MESRASPRAAALALIRMRMKNDARMGAEPPMPETEADVEEVSLPGAALFLFRLSSAAGDRYGFGAEAARTAAPGGGYGWGDKAIVANLRVGRAFVTTMGFHRYVFDMGHISALGAPTSDEYPFEGGSRQDFETGSTFWAPGRGCWHVAASADAVAERVRG